MRKLMLAAAGAAALASGAAAQEVRLAFPAAALDESERQIVAALYSNLPSQGRVGAHGAIAVSPAFFDLWGEDPGTAVLSGLMQVVGDFDTPDEAETAALAACEEARGAGQAACVVGARIEPK